MKALTIVFFCSWKFALTFPMAIYIMKMSFIETILYTNLGGIAGLIFFTLLSNQLIIFWSKYISPRLNNEEEKKVRINKKRRRIIKLKNRYGLLGIVILNPIILSIPISSFLVSKYYGTSRKNLIWLFTGQFLWSIIYTITYTNFNFQHLI